MWKYILMIIYWGASAGVLFGIGENLKALMAVAICNAYIVALWLYADLKPKKDEQNT